jgi:tryptophanyl-tRNA synthetase
MSLKEPHLKMSKSHADPRSRILITDSADEIQRKLLSALTDSTTSISYEPKSRPGLSNLLQLMSHFEAQGRTPEELAQTCANMDFRTLKLKVAETIAVSMEPVRVRYAELMKEDAGAYLDEVEREGARKARESAEETMVLVREAIGL